MRIWLVALCMTLLIPGLGIANESEVDAEHEDWSGVRLGRWANWLFFSFLPDESDDAKSWGLEFESYVGFGGWEIKNISYFEVNQYPRAIPGQPPGNVSPGLEAADGINDLLSAFFLSRQGPHHGGHHFAPGLAFQLPTASDPTLGSEKWSIGPSFDYEYENGNLFAGAIALQIWSFAGASDRKDVSMLMIKPFVYYTFAENWDLIYVPYGVTVYWDKPEGEKMYLPLGGGVQRGFDLGWSKLNLHAQLHANVIRPTKGTKYDLRFLVEFEF